MFMPTESPQALDICVPAYYNVAQRLGQDVA